MRYGSLFKSSYLICSESINGWAEYTTQVAELAGPTSCASHIMHHVAQLACPVCLQWPRSRCTWRGLGLSGVASRLRLCSSSQTLASTCRGHIRVFCGGLQQGMHDVADSGRRRVGWRVCWVQHAKPACTLLHLPACLRVSANEVDSPGHAVRGGVHASHKRGAASGARGAGDKARLAQLFMPGLPLHPPI